MKNLLKETKREQKKLNDEYELLKEQNKLRANDIRASIKDKSIEFNERKINRSKYFDSIRNK
ncbi:hypothetical protein [Niallia sp. 03133]|uniref:hypothetical protein n=1 Tax=Niallia sp. 03133 TaxID=3458060 RepID=UPI004044830E